MRGGAGGSVILWWSKWRNVLLSRQNREICVYIHVRINQISIDWLPFVEFDSHSFLSRVGEVSTHETRRILLIVATTNIIAFESEPRVICSRRVDQLCMSTVYTPLTSPLTTFHETCFTHSFLFFCCSWYTENEDEPGEKEMKENKNNRRRRRWSVQRTNTYTNR